MLALVSLCVTSHIACEAQRWLLPGHEFRGSHPDMPQGLKRAVAVCAHEASETNLSRLIHLGSASDAFWMLLALLESCCLMDSIKTAPPCPTNVAGYHYKFVFAPGAKN